MNSGAYRRLVNYVGPVDMLEEAAKLKRLKADELHFKKQRKFFLLINLSLIALTITFSVLTSQDKHSILATQTDIDQCTNELAAFESKYEHQLTHKNVNMSGFSLSSVLLRQSQRGSGSTMVETLDLSNNRLYSLYEIVITDSLSLIDLSANPFIANIVSCVFYIQHLSQDSLKSVVLISSNNFPNLKTLELQGCSLKTLTTNDFDSLQKLTLIENGLQYIIDNEFPRLRNMTISESKTKNIQLSGIKELRYLALDMPSLRSMQMYDFAFLKKPEIWNTPILESLHLSTMSSLKDGLPLIPSLLTLIVEDGSLDLLDFSGYPKLLRLRLGNLSIINQLYNCPPNISDNTQIDEIRWEPNVNNPIRQLQVAYSNLTQNLSLVKFQKLEVLVLNTCEGSTSFGNLKLPVATNFEVTNCKISYLSLQIPNLYTLILNNASINEFSNCSGSKVNTLVVSNNNNLSLVSNNTFNKATKLDFSSNKLTSFLQNSFLQAQFLNISRNMLNNKGVEDFIENNTFDASVLSQIDLSGNAISNVSQARQYILSKFPNVQLIF